MEFDPARAVPAPPEDAAPPAGPAAEIPPRDARGRGRLRAAKLLAGSLAALVLAALGFDTADMLVRSWEISPWLGGGLAGLLGLAAGSAAVMAGREWRTIARLRTVDRLRLEADLLRAKAGHGGAGPLIGQVEKLYAGRRDLAGPRAALGRALSDAHDDREALALTERVLLDPLDRAAHALVVKAARDVAIGTALSPAALLDAAIVLYRNAKLVRQVATLYAARPGLIGSARLLRRMVENLGVAGIAESGDSLAVDALGGTLAASVSARLGQGLLNGLLTARIGLTAMHLCRPLPFAPDRKPRLADIRRHLLSLPKDVL